MIDPSEIDCKYCRMAVDAIVSEDNPNIPTMHYILDEHDFRIREIVSCDDSQIDNEGDIASLVIGEIHDRRGS